jgi:hypothetical protein
MADTIELPDILGLPPDDYISYALTRSSMLTLEIEPQDTEISTGLNLFEVSDAWTKYEDMLKSYGYENKRPIKLAVLADSATTDTFQNEYGDSIFDRVTDIVSSASGEIAQVIGGRTVGSEVRSIAGKIKSIGGIAGTAGELVESGLDELKKFQRNMETSGGGFGQFVSRTMNLMGSLGAGARLDFPMIWKSSSYASNYSFTVRLYNPNPANISMHKKYIVGPLASILLLGLPIVQEDGFTYQWPFFHKVKCKGLFNLDAAFITGMSVVKGGDQMQIAYTQRPSLIDVRIDFSSMYRSMVANKEDDYHSNQRPTLGSYIENLAGDSKQVLPNMFSEEEKQGAELIVREKIVRGDEPPELILRGSDTVTKSQESSDVYTPSPSRVSSDLKQKLNALKW